MLEEDPDDQGALDLETGMDDDDDVLDGGDELGGGALGTDDADDFNQQGFADYGGSGPGGAFEDDPAFADPDLGDRIAKFNALIYWNDPKFTGLVFLAINVFFFLTYWLHYTVLYLTASLIFYAICISAVCHVVSYAYCTAMQKPLLDTVQGYMKVDIADNLEAAATPMRVEVNPSLAGIIEGGLNLFLKTMQDAILMRNLRLTLATAICAYFVAQFSLVMDAFTMVYFATLMLFTLPKIWEIALGNPQVHEKYVLVQQHARKVWTVINDKVISHIPDGSSTAGGGFSANPAADLRQRRGN